MNSKKKITSLDKSRRTNYHRSGRWLEEPKDEHKIILQALEIANKAFTRVVVVGEVIQALSAKEKIILEDKYELALCDSVSKILGLLCKRGIVFIAGKSGKFNYYGLVGLLNPDDTDLGKFQSRRRKVLNLVRTAVIENNRALQMGEIIDFAKRINECRNLAPELISQSVLSLKEKGELVKISMRGDEKGFGVYLPKEFNPIDFLPKQPLTWLEFILSLFNEIWNEHVSLAENNYKKPSPVTTGEVRAKLLSIGKYSEKLRDPRMLVNAMQQLAKTSNPSLRKIERNEQKTLFWLPADVKDGEVDLSVSYAHDSEKIEEAVKRAGVRFARPVNLPEIKQEVEIDPSLEPDSSSAYHDLLADLSKRKIAFGNQLRKSRIHQRICRIGKFQGKSYYYFNEKIEAAAFIKFRLLEQKWHCLKPDAELTEIETCLLPSVVFGRVKLLTSQTLLLSNELKELKLLDTILGVEKSEIKNISEHISEIKSRTDELIEGLKTNFLNLPERVENKIKGWTSHKLMKMLLPHYHRARNIKIHTNIQSLIGDVIRRIPNPDFQSINSKTPELAAEYLYDETDALIYIAKEWGGVESRYQASLAYHELGVLRDPQFVIPALDSNDFNIRLSAVSCLAFLPSEDGAVKLYQAAMNDRDTGVRQSALWAYGFLVGNDAINFIKERSIQDKDFRVRNFAKNLIEKYTDGWLNF